MDLDNVEPDRFRAFERVWRKTVKRPDMDGVDRFDRARRNECEARYQIAPVTRSGRTKRVYEYCCGRCRACLDYAADAAPLTELQGAALLALCFDSSVYGTTSTEVSASILRRLDEHSGRPEVREIRARIANSTGGIEAALREELAPNGLAVVGIVNGRSIYRISPAGSEMLARYGIRAIATAGAEPLF